MSADPDLTLTSAVATEKPQGPPDPPKPVPEPSGALTATSTSHSGETAETVIPADEIFTVAVSGPAQPHEPWGSPMSELARHICMAANLGMRDDAEQAIDSIVAERDALTREVDQLRAELEQADQFGRGEFRVTEWAYGQATKALEKHRTAWQVERDEVVRMRALLTRRWPIIQAAFAYTDSTADPTDTPHEDALLDAVNDYRALLGTTTEATDAHPVEPICIVEGCDKPWMYDHVCEQHYVELHDPEATDA